MIGRRVNKLAHEMRDGEYGKCEDGNWYAIPPGTDLLAGLAGHQVTEHEDGSITVSPSIEVRGYAPEREINYWHGYLERGVWSEV